MDSYGKGTLALTLKRLRIIDRLLAGDHSEITDTNPGEFYTARSLKEKVDRILTEHYDGQPYSLRTYQTDLALLEEMCFKLYDTPEVFEFKGQPYRSARRYVKGVSLFSKRLSTNEILLLRNLLPVIGKLADYDTLKLLAEPLKGKVNREPVMDTGIKSPENLSFVSMFNAIRDRKSLRFRYRTFRSDEIREIHLIPEFLRQYNGRWFLIGCRADTGSRLTFRIDQILDLRVCDAVREPGGMTPFPRDNYKYIVGVTVPLSEDISRSLDSVLIWLDDLNFKYFITSPPLDEELIEEVTDEALEELRREYPHLKEGHFVTMTCHINFELRQKLMSYMDGLVVLGPEELADDMRERIGKLADLYRDCIR